MRVLKSVPTDLHAEIYLRSTNGIIPVGYNYCKCFTNK